MTVIESLPIAAFCIAMVFAVLACLLALIKIFSFCLKAIGVNPKKSAEANPATEIVYTNEELSSGELKLYDVDERTAAMIMAIVSDESGIPLSELCFNSIKALKTATN